MLRSFPFKALALGTLSAQIRPYAERITSKLNDIGTASMMRFILMAALLFTSATGWAQPWAYDFGTSTGTHPSSSISTTFLPGTPSGGGTYRVRTGAGGGTIVLANPGTTLGSGSELQINAATSTSSNKFGVYDWSSTSTVGYVKFKIRTTSATSGNLNITYGINTVANDNQSYTAHYNNAVASLTIIYTSGAISSVVRRISGSNTTITSSGFSKDTDQAVELYANDGAGSATYYKAGVAYTLNTQSWDLWVDGNKISSAGGWAKAGTLASGTALSGFGFFAESSTSNAAVIHIDELEYSNTLPPQPTLGTPSPTSLTGFTTTQGAPSSAQTFTCSGSDLQADLVVTAPSAFEVREQGVGSYAGSVSFAPGAGSVSKTIEVRLTGAAQGTFGPSNVVISTTGASAGQNVSVSGTVNPSGTTDCLGVIGGSALPGTSCNDNDVCTINDVWSAGCVCAGTFQDTDGDGTCNANDGCPNDPNKIAAGICGCGVADTDSDGDGTPNCNDGCPNDPNKTSAGQCGCGVPEGADTDGDGTRDCIDGCPNDPNKIAEGACGCGNLEVGASCNDGNTCTVNDVITSCGVCAGTPPAATWNFGTASQNASPSSNSLNSVTVSTIGRGNNNGSTTLLTSSSTSTTTEYATASGQFNAGAAAFTGALNTASSTYFEFTISPTSGFFFTLNGISFGTRSTSTGPQAYSVRTNLDNYTTDVATGTMPANSAYVLRSNTGLSVSTFAGLPLVVRIYGHSGVGTPSVNTANWRIDDLSISGCSNTCTNPAIIDITNDSPICSNATLNLGSTVTGSLPITYAWSGTGTFGTPAGPSTTVTGAATGTYTLLVSNVCGTASLGTSVTVNPLPTLSAGSYGPLCSNGTDITLGGSPAGGVWTGTGVSGTGPYTFSPSAGTQTLTYSFTDGNNCSASATTTVTVDPVLNLQANVTNASCPGQSNGAIDLAVTGGAPLPTILWSSNVGCVTDGQCPFPMLCIPGPFTCGTLTSLEDLTGLPAGTYTATVSSGGCTASQAFVVGNTSADTDGDGLCDPSDNCPNIPGQIGSPCNDNDACTINDLITAACVCAGTFQDSDGDGVCDASDNCPNAPGQIGDPCNDGNACTTGEVLDANCTCSGGQMVSCDDGDPCTSDACDPAIGCVFTPIPDSDGDGLCDVLDNCPNAPGQIGDPCNDGSPYTVNDIVLANCTCAGTVVCSEVLGLTLNTDANAAQTSWMVVYSGTNTAVCSGTLTGANNSSTITVNCCVPDGCYDLIVLDQFGDGINPGGFVLRDEDGERIIDNANNGFAFTYGSQVSNWGFCIPMGTQALTTATCDQEALALTSVVQAQPNASVTAAYSTSNSTTGYQFWVYNPNGGFSRRIFFSHASPGTGWPAGAPVAERCSYFRLNAMAASSPVIPSQLLLNVRVRPRVNGVNGEFGPACRLKIDPLNNCQTTQLTYTAQPVVSCGATGLTTSSTVWANDVPGATGYQFEFSRPGYLRRILSPTRSQRLNWVTLPLEHNRCYNVRVRVSFDNSQTYCPFGPTCTVTLGTAVCGGAMAEQPGGLEALEETGRLTLWPNPNRGEPLRLQLTDLPAVATQATVEIMDLYGKRVYATTVTGADGLLNATLELDRDLAAGVYLVTVTAGSTMRTERLVIQR